MIEMLGVLAIIAVLSVGGIAGYSKAMLMWRSNMQKQMISELIAAAIKIRPNLNPKSTKGEDPEYNFSNNLFIGDTANRCAAGIHRSRAVVAHAKVPVIRHLVG